MTEQKKHVLIADWFANDIAIEEQLLKTENCTVSLSGIDNGASNAQKLETLKQAIKTAPRIDALLFSIAPVNAEVIDLLPDECVILQRLGIGLDNVDLVHAKEKGLVVRNTPNYCLEEVAVHSMSLFLALHRQLITTQEYLVSGKWSARPPAPIQRFSTLTLGIAGFGRIGQKLGSLMHPLVGKVIYYDMKRINPFAWADPVSAETLLRESDLISLHLPLLPGTRHFINRDNLAKMKDTAIIVNTARGGLVDAEALAEALNRGQIAGAGLDVYEPEVLPMDSPLRKTKNTILTSHTAWYSEQALIDARYEAMQSILAEFRPTGKSEN